MKHKTLCLPVKNGKILLGMKKRGFGVGKINGFGGKVKPDETVEEAATRELFEEVGLEVRPNELKKVGELSFVFPHSEGDNQIAHVFLIDSWEGEPRESEEMGFEWFSFNDIPFDKMWDDDKYWLPLVLGGRKIRGKFSFREDNSTMDTKEILDLE